MANKGNVNSVKDGDLSNIIVLRSVWGKANQNYVLQPQRDKYGQLPKCVRRVNAQGDMILSEKDRESSGQKTEKAAVRCMTDGKQRQ